MPVVNVLYEIFYVMQDYLFSEQVSPKQNKLPIGTIRLPYINEVKIRLYRIPLFIGTL